MSIALSLRALRINAPFSELSESDILSRACLGKSHWGSSILCIKWHHRKKRRPLFAPFIF
jgi:hypothetical protein